jgi:protocatechuate 3,4-dioxygenase, beta subunit
MACAVAWMLDIAPCCRNAPEYMHRILFIVFLLCVLASGDAFAAAKKKHTSAVKAAPVSDAKCPATPSINEGFPSQSTIVPSNKLALPAGKAVWAPGELVYLSGRVLDKNCVPISDAIMEIWHTNPEGKYVTARLADRVNPYPYFAGSGRAVTDNLGRYNFITTFPGPYGKSAPHIHVRVTHPDFPPLLTEMFFAGDKRNAADAKFKQLKNPDSLLGKVAGNANGSISVKWDIALRGSNKYRKY